MTAVLFSTKTTQPLADRIVEACEGYLSATELLMASREIIATGTGYSPLMVEEAKHGLRLAEKWLVVCDNCQKPDWQTCPHCLKNAADNGGL